MCSVQLRRERCRDRLLLCALLHAYVVYILNENRENMFPKRLVLKQVLAIWVCPIGNMGMPYW